MKPTQTVETTIDVRGVERDVQVTFRLYAAEAPSLSGPGCPAEAEFLEATFEDTGRAVPAAYLPADLLQELGAEALEAYADRMEAETEDAAEARA